MLCSNTLTTASGFTQEQSCIHLLEGVEGFVRGVSQRGVHYYKGLRVHSPTENFSLLFFALQLHYSLNLSSHVFQAKIKKSKHNVLHQMTNERNRIMFSFSITY